MRSAWIGLAALGLAALGLAACGGEVAEPDPYADLGDALRVTVIVSEEADPATCNPSLTYDLRSEAEALRLNVTYLVNQATFAGSGFSLLPSETEGVLTATEPLSQFDPFEGACSETDIAVHDFKCDDSTDCPTLEFVGTDQFQSFKPLN